jgi:NTP pyrophosphatase (non-canonical NTP hydrolase)
MSELSFREYQEKSAETAIYPEDTALAYLTLGLTGEAGEIANKIKKVIRDSKGELSEDLKKDLVKECGDTLWYLSQLIRELDGDFGDVAQANIDKLQSRKERGVLKGSGDNR